MKTRLLYCAVGCVIGICIGIIVTFIAYPFIFPPPVLNEQVADLENKSFVFTGTFIHPNPSDPVHWGKGNATIYQQGNRHEVFLQEDFEVGPGPAYHVYLSSGVDILNNNDFENSVNIDLGGLKSFKGSQVYPVPGNSGITNSNSIVIWCKAFGQLISSARLR